MKSDELIVRERMNDLSSFDIKYDVEFLMILNKYLIKEIDDFYLNSQLDQNDYNNINNLLKKIENNINIEEIFNILSEIWNYQIFSDLNTRTLYTFLKLHLKKINKEELFDFNTKIVSGKFRK